MGRSRNLHDLRSPIRSLVCLWYDFKFRKKQLQVGALHFTAPRAQQLHWDLVKWPLGSWGHLFFGNVSSCSMNRYCKSGVFFAFREKTWRKITPPLPSHTHTPVRGLWIKPSADYTTAAWVFDRRGITVGTLQLTCYHSYKGTARRDKGHQPHGFIL